MTVGFYFSEDPSATLSQKSREAVRVLSDIENTMIGGEIGTASILPDESLRVEFLSFILVMKPDGTFHGERKEKLGK